MNAVQLLEEVRRIPGYGNPDHAHGFYYSRVLTTINLRRDILPAYTTGGKPFNHIVGGTPFDYIDNFIGHVLSNIQSSPLDARETRSALDLFKSYHRGIVIGTLDNLIRRAMQQRRAEEQNSQDATSAFAEDLDFIRQMPSRAARYRQHPQNEIELYRHDTETLSELEALKELLELYARAAINQHGQRLEFFLEVLGKNLPPHASISDSRQQL